MAYNPKYDKPAAWWVKRALSGTEAITCCGSWHPDTKRMLDKLVKHGKLVKSRGHFAGCMGSLRSFWHTPEYDFLAKQYADARELYNAAGTDASNVAMRKAGRKAWSREDYDIGNAVTNRLLMMIPFQYGGLGGLPYGELLNFLSPEVLAKSGVHGSNSLAA